MVTVLVMMVDPYFTAETVGNIERTLKNKKDLKFWDAP